MASAQRGYALLIVLIALAVVGFLARDAIMQAFGTLTRGASSNDSRMSPARPSNDPTVASPTATAPVERARSVEDVVRERAGKRIDATQ